MKTNMTERDKKLIVFMLIVVIVVGIGYWGVVPQIKAINSLKDKTENEVAEQKINKLKIQNISIVEMQADDYEKDVAAYKNEFYQMMTSSEIDKMMTLMAADKGLSIYDLKFNMPGQPSERMAYNNSELYKIQLDQKNAYESENADDFGSSDPEDELLGDDGDAESASIKKEKKETITDINSEIMGEEEGYQPNTDLYAVPVSMTVGGNISDLHAFLNSIIVEEKRILLVGYSWGEYKELLRYDSEGNLINSSGYVDTGISDKELENENVKVVTKKSLTVKLEIYMCDTSDVTTSVDGELDSTSEDVVDEEY